MTRKARFEAIVDWFAANRPEAQSELDFDSPFQLICAVVLSAQCTDKRVNMVTPALFERYPSPDALAKAEAAEVYELIKSVSYPNSKAAHLAGMARRLVEVYGGQVPSDIDELMTLPGVGRKTANVVASIVYDKPVIAVDTHVFRVAHRLGLSDGKTPEAVERDLEAHIAEELRPVAHHWLILHGRYICTARTPRCGECALKQWCKSYKADR